MAETTADEPSDLRSVFPLFTDRFEKIRLRKELTISRLAELTQLTRPTLSRLAAGDSNPRILNVSRVARALGVSTHMLLGPEAGVGNGETESTIASESPVSAFLAPPPRADSRALDLYERLVNGESLETIHRIIQEQRLTMPGEDAETALSRLILDLFHDHQVSIDPHSLPRDRELERTLTRKLELGPRTELRDSVPVRVAKLPDWFPPVLRVLALGAIAAEILKELLSAYRIIGFSDGFTTSATQLFLRRGDLYRVEAIPLVFTPQHAQFELSGTALIGSLIRSHLGYGIESTVELRNLKRKLGQLQVAVLSCGAAERDLDSRLPRIIHAANPNLSYESFQQRLRERGVVGDLMYHFLDKNGHEARIEGATRDLEDVGKYKVRHPKEGDPLIFAASLDGLADVAERGVSMLVVPSRDRAPVVKAAMRRHRRPANLLVTGANTAREIAGGGS